MFVITATLREKNPIAMKLSGEICNGIAVKFAKWQHREKACRVRFAVPNTTCYVWI